jgi:alanine-glyoxylate transaminase/serine-glyoxylate transaminase/serine-pyruvate transaminase
LSPKPRGRQFFANPGPTNIPDSILRAIDRPSLDFMDEDFTRLMLDCVARLKRIVGTQGELFMYTASGHGAWEASLVNLFSPGDRLLMLESGYFSETWAAMARNFGLEVQMLDADWRHGAQAEAVEAALRADTAHAIKGVCTVHNETSTGITLPLKAMRDAIDAARHPALLLSDTISSLGSIDYRMDEWGIDVCVGGSQKGLMLPTGLSFTAASAKAMEAHKASTMPKHYLNWSNMMGRKHRSFVGTVPTHMFHGMAEALRLLDEEGMPAVYARHARLAGAVRAAVQAWMSQPGAGNQGPEFFCQDAARRSNSVTAVLMPEGHNADALRQTALAKYNVSLGGGLGRLGGKVFRIGHLGDLNEPMVLGTLGAVELALRANGVPHGEGGMEAALAALAG